jgi:hypothetical protein
LARLKAITGKRARTVIDHILKHGSITAEELKEKYGYDHPPRAIRDVKEQGIPLERFKAQSRGGRTIAAYRFPELGSLRGGTHSGRRQFTKAFKQLLEERNGARCAICYAVFPLSALQIDHRVPYEVAGDVRGELDPAEFMLVCGSCNRAKSWSCEHCENWISRRDPKTCLTCYWGTPTSYSHIALRPIRRLDLVWQEDETSYYDAILRLSEQQGLALPDYVKNALWRHAKNASSSASRTRRGRRD